MFFIIFPPVEVVLIGFKVVEEVEVVMICFIVLGILCAEADRELEEEEEEEEDGKEEEEDGKEEEVVVEDRDDDDDKKAGRTTDDAVFVTLLNASILSKIGLLRTLSEEIG